MPAVRPENSRSAPVPTVRSHTGGYSRNPFSSAMPCIVVRGRDGTGRRFEPGTRVTGPSLRGPQPTRLTQSRGARGGRRSRLPLGCAAWHRSAQLAHHRELGERRRVDDRPHLAGLAESAGGVELDSRVVRARHPEAQGSGSTVSCPSDHGLRERPANTTPSLSRSDKHSNKTWSRIVWIVGVIGHQLPRPAHATDARETPPHALESS